MDKIDPSEIARTPGQVHITRRVDNNFRGFLLRASPDAISVLFAECFANGPRRGGAAETLKYFGGDTAHPGLLSTVPVVEECERYMPGLMNWLAVTGFADDLDMVKAFMRWAELADGGDILERARQVQ